MNKKEWMDLHAYFTKQMRDITARKNADYTGLSGDPFANFKKVEELGIATTEQGFLTRMVDKLMRLTSFVQKGVLEVKDESVIDTCLDMANYSLLFAGYILDKKRAVDTVDGTTPHATITSEVEQSSPDTKWYGL